jgi:ligand-binding sensor domain-containing protein/signal transduction histidine kinase/DNA-binding response OmpR family regulator
MIKKFILLKIAIVVVCFCNGQNNRINFQSIQNGLSNPCVKCILKDSKGYLWFGTSEGLNKFDGSNFTLYEKNTKDTNSLVNNNIGALLEDNDHYLWIGTASGLCLYNREKDNFKVISAIGKDNLFPISSLIEDVNSNIWVGTSGAGLYKYDKSNICFLSYMPDKKDSTSISSNFINSIISNKEGQLWVATRNGLDMYDARTNSFTQSNNGKKLPPELANGNIKDLCFDKKGNLWVGTYGNGLFEVIDQNNGWCINHYSSSGKKGSLSNNDILCLISDKYGNIWIGTENAGLNIFSPDAENFSVYKNEDGNLQSISSNSIWSIYQDDTGIIWIGTYNHGINYIDEKIEKFEVYERNYAKEYTLVNNNVSNFTEDKSGTIWIATDGGGISSFNPKNRSFTNKIDNTSITSKAVTAILCDSRHHIWVGTWGGGVDLFSIEGKKIKNYKFDAYQRPGNISCLLEDNKGNIWVGTSGNGLFLYNHNKDDFSKIVDTTLKTPLSERSFINVLYQDSENNFWLGLPTGLIRLKIINGEITYSAFTHSNDQKSISSSSVTAILEDSFHDIWIGTSDGLNRLNKKDGTFTIFKKENGLANNSINSILEDNYHCLWLSTYGGISKFDIRLGKFKNYSKDDGLPSNSFNPNSGLKTQTGEFFIGCNNGFVAFYPDSIKSNTYIPPVYFTNFKTYNSTSVIGDEGSPLNKNICENRSITLNYKQTSFTIEFVALNFTHSTKNQYAYMLEGFDNDWRYVATQQYATYTNIDAGKYVFKVKGSNNEGIWNPIPAQIDIEVLPPYWRTKWAYISYFVFITFIIWIFIKLLIIKSNQAEKLKLEKIHHEKSEELNRMKIQFFANISHEFRTPLSLILAPLKDIIENDSLKSDIKSRIKIVFNNANKMYRLVNELMDFSKSEEGRLKMMVQKVDIILFARDIYNLFVEEAKRRKIKYDFLSECISMEIWFDKSKMEKIISNLLSNAFKYTQEEGEIFLKIRKEIVNGYDFVCISVIDNGSGIAAEYIDKVFDRFYQSPEYDNKISTGTGIGLALVKSLVELHHGFITVKSQKWIETCFTFKIPFGNAHFEKTEILDETGEFFISPTEKPITTDIEKKNKNKGNAPLILIVEDNYDLRRYLAEKLSSIYKILQATDGLEGLKIARETIPDLIISDIGMPRLSGIDLCKSIKSEMSTSHIPVILLTAKASTSDIITGVETGADTYMTKPFDIQHLIVTIEKTIENRRKLYQRFSQDIYIIPNECANNKLDREFLKNIIDYIDKNVTNYDITVENLAAQLLMSRTNVYRKIKALTGQTATEFIRITRLKMAVKLLEDGNYNMSEIAFKVGFSSPGYFTKCFKDHYGKSPSGFVIQKGKKK